MMRREASISLTQRVDLRGLPWAVARAASVHPVLLQNTFTGVNGTALSAYTPDIDVVGDGWSYDAGTLFTINSNRLEIGPEVPSRAIIDCGRANIKITGTLITPGDDTFQVLFRWQDSNNYIRAGFDLIALGSMFIQKFVAGAPTLVDSLVTSIWGAQTINFEITVVGTTITLRDLTNNKVVSGVVTEHQANTIVGLGDAGAATGPIVVDNFLVVME